MQSQSPFGSLDESARRLPSQWAGDNRFSHRNYLVRRKLLKLVGAAFYVDDPSGNVVLYANQKGFKLKEDIRLYTGEDMTKEMITIRARNILDISATYDVTDATTGEKLGALRRKGFKSMIQDEWIFLDAQDREMGTLQEESMVLALIRRFIDFATFFLPQQYNAKLGGREVATYKQTKNPLLIKIQVDFSPDTGGVLDRRLGLAAAILLSAIEGKQH
ncbi:MAG TPA: hypothetical protein VF600_07460 [Abditibacteriaceae bacterium]|jgi:uncharacterized protein YxjI